MRPSTAEFARTVASGRLPGMVAVRHRAWDGCVPVVHAVDETGRILLAADEGSLASQVLSDGCSAVLSVIDAPPLPDAPLLGLVFLAGWVSKLSDAEARMRVDDLAAANPHELLLDVGRGTDLFELDPTTIRVERDRITTDVDLIEFVAARPDPFHPDERELLEDLRDHHAVEVAALFNVTPGNALVVRLNRHGLLVRVHHDRGSRLMRVDFHRPANGLCCVARALRLHH